MALSQLNGANYTVDGQQISFFDAKGTVLGKNWGINALGGSVFWEVEPASIMGTIRDCIDGDIESGNGDKIAQLQLGPTQAVIFYLEGKLTREHLKKSIEGVDFIDIPDVEVEGRVLTVRVLQEALYEVATADAEGNVLP